MGAGVPSTGRTACVITQQEVGTPGRKASEAWAQELGGHATLGSSVRLFSVRDMPSRWAVTQTTEVG